MKNVLGNVVFFIATTLVVLSILNLIGGATGDDNFKIFALGMILLGLVYAGLDGRES